MAEGIKPPPPLDWSSPKVGSLWDDWIDQMNLYLDLAKFSAQGATAAEKAASLLAMKKNTFLYCLGIEGAKVLKALKIKDEEGNVVEQKENQTLGMWQKALGEFFKPKRTVVLDRIQFLRIRQQEDEQFEQYLFRLRAAVKTCSWRDVDEDQMILLQIVQGIKDKSVREALFHEKNLTVTTAEDYCHFAEISRVQSNEIDRQENSELVAVMQDRPKKRMIRDCIYCGRSKHKKGKCPAAGKECFDCKRKNHFAGTKACRDAEEARLRDQGQRKAQV